VVIKM